MISESHHRQCLYVLQAPLAAATMWQAVWYHYGMPPTGRLNYTTVAFKNLRIAEVSILLVVSL
jgi:hypothetical protein